MGFFDDLLPGEGPTLKPSPVELGDVVGAWFAARTMGGFSIAGGAVVLGRDWLVFSPWDLDRTRAWLVTWLGRAGVPYLGHLDRLLSATKLLEPVAIPLDGIASAELLSDGSLFKPPQVRLGFVDGRHFDLGILASPTSLNVSGANREALEDFVAKLAAQVELVRATATARARTPGWRAPAQRPPTPAGAAAPAYTGPIDSSPMARAVAMDQLRLWRSSLSPAEFAAAKARKLAEVGLAAGQPPQAGHVSPMSQQVAVDQATQFASLVPEGVLTQDEYGVLRQVMLREQGLA